MNINTPSLGTLQPISSVGSANTTGSVAHIRDQLFNQRMEETLKTALDSLQTNVDMATNASSDGTVIDERLANFWNNFSDEDESGNSLGQMFSTQKDALTYVKQASLTHLAQGVSDLHREIKSMPAGAERDKAMARLDEFDATSKQAIQNDYAAGVKDANKMPRGHYFASFHAPNYEALKSPPASGSRIDAIGLLEEDDEEVQLLPRRQLPRVEEPGDDDDNITFGPNIGTGLPRNQFEANPRANPRGLRTMEETPEDRGEPSVTAFSMTPRNALFAELELQTELVNQLQARLQR